MFRRVGHSLRTNTLVGLLLITPVVATVLIFRFLLGLATNWGIEHGFFDVWKEAGLELLLRILILCAIIGLLYLVGLFARNILGRRLFHLGDKVISAIPFIRNIYVAVRQISESLFTQRKSLFKEVVLVEYPRKGLYSIAFVTADVPLNISTRMSTAEPNDRCVSLFIPTTPNPTSGLLILVPAKDVRRLPLPVTDALTFVMSGGAVRSGEPAVSQPRLLDRIEAWLKHEDEPDVPPSDATKPNANRDDV
jgi:uncharacterized membrane protein